MTQDYGRKNYSDNQYRDWMRNKTSKAVHDSITKAYPGTSEFSRVIRTTPLSRSIQRYIAQSEFKKPYNGKDFIDMEGDWEGPGNGLEFRPGWDNPWSFGYGVATEPGELIFLAQLVAPWDTYCRSATRKMILISTQPVVSVTLSFSPHADSVLKTIVGLGSRSLYLELYTPAEQTGAMQLDVESVGVFPDGTTTNNHQFIPFYEGDALGTVDDPTSEDWNGCCQGHEDYYEPQWIDAYPTPTIYHKVTCMQNISEGTIAGPNFFTYNEAKTTSPCSSVQVQWTGSWDHRYGGYFRHSCAHYDEPGTPLGPPPLGTFPNPRWVENWPSITNPGPWYPLFRYSFFFIQFQINQPYPIYQGVIEMHQTFEHDPDSFYSADGGTDRSAVLTDTLLDDTAAEYGNLTSSNFLDRGTNLMAPYVEVAIPGSGTTYVFEFELNTAALARLNAANAYFGGSGYCSFCIRDYQYDWLDVSPVDVDRPWITNGYAIQGSPPLFAGLFSTCYDPIDPLPDP